MEIVSDFTNALLKRKEIVASHNYESNPGIAQATKDVADLLNVGEDVVVIKKVGSSFGSGEFLIEAFVYDSLKSRELMEPRKKEKKGKKK